MQIWSGEQITWNVFYLSLNGNIESGEFQEKER